MPNRRFPEPVLIFCSLGLMLSSQAMAQTATYEASSSSDTGSLTLFGQPASLMLGAGADVAPAYEGAKKFRVGPVPYVDAKLFNDRVFLSSTGGLGANIVKLGRFEAGLAATYGGGRNSSDSPRLKGFKDQPGEFGVIGFMKYDLKPLTFELKAKNDFGPNPGTEVTFATKYDVRPIRRLNLSMGPQVTWSDSRYNKSHFGVTPAEAASATAQGNAMQAYSPGSGIKDVGFSMTAIYQITQHWGWVTHVGLSELVGSPATDSPLTQRKFQPSFATGIAYKF